VYRYKVCLMVYGQSGSGKTHTICGGLGDQRGIVPRAVEGVICRAREMTEEGWTVSATLSIVELYNENFRDLLSTDPQAGERVKVGLVGDRVNISGLSVHGLDLRCVGDGMRQFDEILVRASAARAVASTLMNDQSSRSHMVFLLDISCRHDGSGDTYMGGLRFVDLAGSERLDRTGTADNAARLRETVNINKSLSCLGDVFSAIGSKQSHVPFRNSKLTMLLQDCLSGEGKALMLVNVSPTLASSAETLCSLRFASQVNRVELGRATKACFSAPTPQAQVTYPVHDTHSRVNSYHTSVTERSRPAKRQLQAIDEECEVENRPINLVGSLSSRASIFKATAGPKRVSALYQPRESASCNSFLAAGRSDWAAADGRKRQKGNSNSSGWR
jgi:kinesin family protein C1